MSSMRRQKISPGNSCLDTLIGSQRLYVGNDFESHRYLLLTVVII